MVVALSTRSRVRLSRCIVGVRFPVGCQVSCGAVSEACLLHYLCVASAVFALAACMALRAAKSPSQPTGAIEFQGVVKGAVWPLLLGSGERRREGGREGGRKEGGLRMGSGLAWFSWFVCSPWLWWLWWLWCGADEMYQRCLVRNHCTDAPDYGGRPPGSQTPGVPATWASTSRWTEAEKCGKKPPSRQTKCRQETPDTHSLWVQFLIVFVMKAPNADRKVARRTIRDST